jgi:hypothetical protein
MEQLHKWEYLVPYHVRPQLFPSEPNEVTAVTFDFAYTHKDGSAHTASLDFDKEIDRLVLFVQDFRDAHPDLDLASIGGEDGATLQQAVRDAFKAKRERESAAFEEKKQRLDAYNAAQLDQLRQMRVYKFYPNHPTIDVTPFVDKKVNIYIGDADVTAPPLAGYVAPSSPRAHFADWPRHVKVRHAAVVAQAVARLDSSFALTPAASLSVPMAADGSSPRADNGTAVTRATRRRPPHRCASADAPHSRRRRRRRRRSRAASRSRAPNAHARRRARRHASEPRTLTDTIESHSDASWSPSICTRARPS